MSNIRWQVICIDDPLLGPNQWYWKVPTNWKIKILCSQNSINCEKGGVFHRTWVKKFRKIKEISKLKILAQGWTCKYCRNKLKRLSKSSTPKKPRTQNKTSPKPSPISPKADPSWTIPEQTTPQISESTSLTYLNDLYCNKDINDNIPKPPVIPYYLQQNENNINFNRNTSFNDNSEELTNEQYEIVTQEST